MKRPFLSIIMPALNEEKNILSAIDNTLKGFNDFTIDGELIIINDGSSDRTPDLVKERISNECPKVRLIDHAAPQGIGACFWDGVLNAEGEVVCTLPGDNENEPGEIFRYLKLLEDVDIAIPFVYNKRSRTLFRNILSFACLNVLHISFGVYFNYTNGTVLYRKSILDDIDYRSKSFFFQADILIRLVKRGYLFAEIPYRLGLRKSGKSKATRFSSILPVAKDYLRLMTDIYITKKERVKKHKFSKDSISERRYKELEGLNG